MAKKLYGIIPPAVTPFFDDEIDYDAFRAHVRWLLSKNVPGVSVGGSTGEGYALSDDELGRLLEIAVAEAGERVVVAGIIRDSTRDAVRYAKVAEQAGADYLMVTPVHYLKANDEAHYSFYKAINDAVSTPTIVYNVVPTSVITPACMQRLATLPRIQGIKQSGGDLHALADMVQVLPKGFPVLSAVDDLLYSTYVIGAVGAIAAITTVLPDLTLEQFAAVEKGDHARALAIHNQALKVWRGMDGCHMVAKAKVALRMRGQNVGQARGPMTSVTPAEEEALRVALQEIGLI